MGHMDADYASRKKAWRQLHKNATSYIEQIRQATSHQIAGEWPPTTHLEEHPN